MSESGLFHNFGQIARKLVTDPFAVTLYLVVEGVQEFFMALSGTSTCTDA